jgi:hypothetical protein
MDRAHAQGQRERGEVAAWIEPALADQSPSPSSAAARSRPAPSAPTPSAESHLASLASAVGPLRRLLAAIAARLIATRAHERLCYARLGDYARERVGLSARQLQDLARVHGALEALPRLERALVANELPWSKVRLVARVASEADEETWIARARSVPTRRLEQDVRDRARVGETETLDKEGPLARVTVRCTPAVRAKWELTREMSERVVGGRLRAADVLELVTAEAFSSFSIDASLDDAPEAHGRQPRCADVSPEHTTHAEAPRTPARPLPRSLEALASGLDEADAFDLDRRLRSAVKLEQTLDAAMAPLLRVVAAAEHEWSDAYRPLAAYARDELGMSATKARTLLRLERAGDVCPELRDAYRSGRLSWVKAHCLVPLLLLDLPGKWRGNWVAWAERVTVRRLEADVARALLLRAGTHLAWQRCKFHPERAQDPIPEDERQLCAREIDTEATQQLEWRVPYDVAWLFCGVRETLRARLHAEGERPPLDGEVFGALLDHSLLAWTLRDPDARRPDPIIERDGYRCAVPGCTSRRNLHDHHLTFRSAGGSDAPENRVALCAFHHQRCLHAGLLRVRGRAPHELVFELGVRPGTPPLACFRSGDVVRSPVEDSSRARVSRAA